MQAQQIAFIQSHNLQDFMDLHYAPSNFHGRIMVGSRKKNAQSVYQVACYPVGDMSQHLKKMKLVNQDYYITANSFSGISRNISSLFALHNIVIDIDCHGEVTEIERSYAIHDLIQNYYKYTSQTGILCANTIVRTGRGVQLWWAINPVSSKWAESYRTVLAYLCSQVNEMIDQKQELKKYFGTIDSAPSSNLAGYFRLPGAYNTKSHTHGSFEILHSGKLDIISLAERIRKPRKTEHIHIRKNIDFETARLAKNRLHQLTRLRDLRCMSRQIAQGEQRDLYIFILFNSICKAYKGEGIRKILRTFNAGFRNPLADKELFRNLSTSEKKGGYAISNKWIIEQLQVTPEEQAEIGLYVTGDKRGSLREIERTKKRQEKLLRNEKIVELYMDGAGSYEEIASLVGCSKETVGRVIRKSGIKRTAEQTRDLIIKMHDDQGMEINEIAELLGVSQRTVTKYLYNSREIDRAAQKNRLEGRTEPLKGSICVIKKSNNSSETMEESVKNAYKYLLYRGEYSRNVIYKKGKRFCFKEDSPLGSEEGG